MTSGVSAAAVLVTLFAVAGVEGPRDARHAGGGRRGAHAVSATRWREVWADPQARRFTIFVFVSMLAYSAQDLILEPFAGVGVRLHARRVDDAVGRAARAACWSA